MDRILTADDLNERLKIYFQLLIRWQKTINLVAPSTMANAWVRHFVDSIQILETVPNARRWVDMGSGAGFPGLVTAIQLAGVKDAAVHLIESDQRKCAFLREVSRETGASATVHNGRIEDVLSRIDDRIDAVSARALGPLSRLIELSADMLLKGAIGVFPKGQDVVRELTGYATDSRFDLQLLPSITDPRAKIVLVRASRL